MGYGIVLQSEEKDYAWGGGGVRTMGRLMGREKEKGRERERVCYAGGREGKGKGGGGGGLG